VKTALFLCRPWRRKKWLSCRSVYSWYRNYFNKISGSSPDSFMLRQSLSGSLWRVGCVGPSVVLDRMLRRKISYFCRESNHDSLGFNPVVSSLYRVCLSGILVLILMLQTFLIVASTNGMFTEQWVGKAEVSFLTGGVIPAFAWRKLLKVIWSEWPVLEHRSKPGIFGIGKGISTYSRPKRPLCINYFVKL
jgi:hypothetical protein